MKSTSFRFSSPPFSFFFFFVVLFIASAIAQQDSDDDGCTYRLNVKTGDVNNAGTNSRISVELGDGSHTWMIPDLESYGVMPPDHDYFDRGILDYFVIAKGPCLPRPLCRINVTSSGTGYNHRWFVQYVEIIYTEASRTRMRNKFIINEWLATDIAPFQLSTRVDDCGK